MVENTTPSAADYALAEKIVSFTYGDNKNDPYLYSDDVTHVAQLIAAARTPEERRAGELRELVRDFDLEVLALLGVFSEAKYLFPATLLELRDSAHALLAAIERERAEGETK